MHREACINLVLVKLYARFLALLREQIGASDQSAAANLSSAKFKLIHRHHRVSQPVQLAEDVAHLLNKSRQRWLLGL